MSGIQRDALTARMPYPGLLQAVWQHIDLVQVVLHRLHPRVCNQAVRE